MDEGEDEEKGEEEEEEEAKQKKEEDEKGEAQGEEEGEGEVDRSKQWGAITRLWPEEEEQQCREQQLRKEQQEEEERRKKLEAEGADSQLQQQQQASYSSYEEQQQQQQLLPPQEEDVLLPEEKEALEEKKRREAAAAKAAAEMKRARELAAQLRQRNEELERGDWLDTVILDESKPPKKPPLLAVLLDANDPYMAFEPELEPFLARKVRLRRIFQVAAKKLQDNPFIDYDAEALDRMLESEGAQLDENDREAQMWRILDREREEAPYNLSNDRFYTLKKRQIRRRELLPHSHPAARLHEACFRSVISLID